MVYSPGLCLGTSDKIPNICSDCCKAYLWVSPPASTRQEQGEGNYLDW